MKYLGLVLGCILVFSAFAYVQPARAVTLSPGCAAINGWTVTVPLSTTVDSPMIPFYKGEIVTITATLGSGATIAYSDFWVNGDVVQWQVPVPATYQYTVPEDGDYIGTVGNNPYLDGNGPIDYVFACSSVPVPGPGVPSGFVLRTITCDVPVYTLPGGIETSATIKNGQTWFVSPTPVKDSAGASWTEIFVASYVNGFIPAGCVGGKPEGYLGD